MSAVFEYAEILTTRFKGRFNAEGHSDAKRDIDRPQRHHNCHFEDQAVHNDRQFFVFLGGVIWSEASIGALQST